LARPDNQLRLPSQKSEKQMATTTTQLSEKGKERLRMNAEARERESKYVTLQIGQK
jgi:hypothetical protein